MKKKILTWTASIIALFVASMLLMSCMASRPDNLGVKNGRLTDCPSSPNCVCTFEKESDKKHYIPPLPYTFADEEVMDRVKKALKEMARTEIITEDENYLHVECTSLIFRFTDDLEIYIDKGAKLIHFRSASRVGHSDLGANRKRVEKLKELIN